MTWAEAITASLLLISATAETAASESFTPEVVEGRWRVAEFYIKQKQAADVTNLYANTDIASRLRFDMVPCGDAWCGIEVLPDGKCGRVAMHLTPSAPKDFIVNHLTGRYDGTLVTSPHLIGLYIWEKDGRRQISLHGNTGDEYIAFSFGAYPLSMGLSREGDAVCKLAGQGLR